MVNSPSNRVRESPFPPILEEDERFAPGPAKAFHSWPTSNILLARTCQLQCASGPVWQLEPNSHASKKHLALLGKRELYDPNADTVGISSKKLSCNYLGCLMVYTVIAGGSDLQQRRYPAGTAVPSNQTVRLSLLLQWYGRWKRTCKWKIPRHDTGWESLYMVLNFVEGRQGAKLNEANLLKWQAEKVGPQQPAILLFQISLSPPKAKAAFLWKADYYAQLRIKGVIWRLEILHYAALSPVRGQWLLSFERCTSQ